MDGRRPVGQHGGDIEAVGHRDPDASSDFGRLTTGGARVRGIELPVGSQVTLEFTPPYRHEMVSVRAIVAHGTHRAERPWIGVIFRLVAMRGGVT